jgi:hypothetical protein
MRSGPLTVDFYLYSSHEVAVWEPIWRALRRRGVDAQIVLEPPGVHAAMGTVPLAHLGWSDDKSGDLHPLVDDATAASLAALLERRGLPALAERRADADAVITTQGAGWLWSYHGLRIKTEYGASAFHGAFGHGVVNSELDAVLAHGPYSAQAISGHLPRSQVHVVGYPKWAPALRDGLDRQSARALLGLPADEVVVAWLPTWAHNAGIDRYRDALASLADRHVVVAKPHHNNLRFEAERLAAIDPRIEVRSDLHSLVELMIAADVVVADARSGALAETLLADRPAVGLLPDGTPGDHGILAGLEKALLWCNDPDALVDAVEQARHDDLAAARAPWRTWLFGDVGPYDDERAADTIIALIVERRNTTSMDLDGPTLDRELRDIDPHDGRTAAAVFTLAWPRWTGHPQLLGLLARCRDHLEIDALIACARAVRTAGLIEACPLVATLADPDSDVVRQLAAAASLALDFDQHDAADVFAELTAALDPARFVDTLRALDHVPASLPAFVAWTATDPARCNALAIALASLGAHDEAHAVADHGRTLEMA